MIVTKATPAVSWNAPADIVYGTALGAAQLNATANVPGHVRLLAGRGHGAECRRADAVGDVHAGRRGELQQRVGDVTLNVAKAAPTISWSNPADIVYGTALGAPQLNATASVAGTFSYSPAAGTVLSAGSQTLSVTFTPDDAANYNGRRRTSRSRSRGRDGGDTGRTRRTSSTAPRSAGRS